MSSCIELMLIDRSGCGVMMPSWENRHFSFKSWQKLPVCQDTGMFYQYCFYHSKRSKGQKLRDLLSLHLLCFSKTFEDWIHLLSKVKTIKWRVDFCFFRQLLKRKTFCLSSNFCTLGRKMKNFWTEHKIHARIQDQSSSPGFFIAQVADYCAADQQKLNSLPNSSGGGVSSS